MMAATNAAGANAALPGHNAIIDDSAESGPSLYPMGVTANPLEQLLQMVRGVMGDDPAQQT